MHLITSLEPSGAERVVYELATRTDRSRFAVSAACIRAVRGEVGQWLERAGIRVHYLDVKSKFSPAKFFSLVNLLKRERVKILHTHLFHGDQAGRIAARLTGVPAVVSTEHIVERRRLPWRTVINAMTWRMADKIICVSNSVRNHLRTTHRIPPGRLAVIPNGIDIEKLRVPISKTDARRKFRLPEQARVVASAGRLDYQKGYDLLIHTVLILIKRFPELVFCIAGDGPDNENLAEQARGMGLQNIIRFLGQVNNVPELLQAADFYVQPSRWEGHPLALIEAMAVGLPVVATDVPGNRDAIISEETGILVEVESPESLAAGLGYIISEEEKAAKLGAAAAAFANREYDAKTMAARYGKIYEELGKKA